MNSLKSIGSTSAVTPDSFVLRSSGETEKLEPGDPVYEGDQITTGETGSVSIIFEDQSIFSISSNSSIEIDQMVYDISTQSGEMSLHIVEGVATFISGFIAKTSPDAMNITTPVATIGIRGTQVGISVNEKETEVVLMEEVDGFVGEIVVYGINKIQVINQKEFATRVLVEDPNPVEPYPLDIQMILDKFGVSVDLVEESLEFLNRELPELELDQIDLYSPEPVNKQFDVPDLNEFQTDSGIQGFQENFTRVTLEPEISNEIQDIFASVNSDLVDRDISADDDLSKNRAVQSERIIGIDSLPESITGEANTGVVENENSESDGEIGTKNEEGNTGTEPTIVSSSTETKHSFSSNSSTRTSDEVTFIEEKINGSTYVYQVTQSYQITDAQTLTYQFDETESVWSDGSITIEATEPVIADIEESSTKEELGEPEKSWFSITSTETMTETETTQSEPFTSHTTEDFEVILVDPATGEEFRQISRVETVETYFEISSKTTLTPVTTTVFASGDESIVVYGETTIETASWFSDPIVVISDPEIISYEPIEDHDKGHGNDSDSHDDDNPGHGHGPGHDAGHGNGHGNGHKEWSADDFGLNIVHDINLDSILDSDEKKLPEKKKGKLDDDFPDQHDSPDPGYSITHHHEVHLEPSF